MKNIKSLKNIMMCGENASYGVNAENRLNFIHFPPLLYSYSITLYRRELTDGLYATIQDTPQDIKVINLSTVCLVHLFFQPSFN